MNPFGSYATRLFEPIVVSTRRPKLLLHRDQRPRAQVVVLGSSRSFTLEPGYIRARTSRPAFNAAVHGARIQDYLDFARCFAEEGSFPAVLIVALGIEQMLAPGLPVEPAVPLGSCLRPENMSVPLFLSVHRRLFTFEELSATTRALALEVTGRPAPRMTFAADGTLRATTGLPLEEAVAAGLAGNHGPWLFQAEALDPRPVDGVRQLLELSRQHSARVIAYVPPYHPAGLARYVRESRFTVLRAQLLRQLAAWAREFPLEYHDFSEVQSFGGSADMFSDAQHPREDAGRLMLDLMLPAGP